MESERPSPARAWMAAARPQTLTASLAPVLVGAALAYTDGYFQPWPTLAAATGAILIQVGTNLANDYHDHRRGADAPGRAGPPRASASGWIRPERVLAGAFVSFALAALVGAYLIWVAGWPIVVIGLLSLASGYAYTGGPYPLGYHGWGDVFVFIFFGLVAVGGTYYVIALHVDAHVLVASVAIACLVTAILVVNNLRDVETDRRAGKKTFAVRFGAHAARWEYGLLLAVAYLVPGVLYLRHSFPPGVFLPLLSAPLAFYLGLRIWTAPRPADLNPALGGTALLLMLYALLLAAGVVLPL